MVDGSPFEHYLADAHTVAVADSSSRGASARGPAATAVGKDVLPRPRGPARRGHGVRHHRRRRRQHFLPADVGRQRHRDLPTSTPTPGDFACAVPPLRRPPRPAARAIQTVTVSADTADRLRGVQRDRVRAPGPHRGRRRLPGGRGLKTVRTSSLPRAAVRRARRRDGRHPRGLRRRLRPQRPAGGPDRQGRRARPLHRRRASPAPSSTWPA